MEYGWGAGTVVRRRRLIEHLPGKHDQRTHGRGGVAFPPPVPGAAEFVGLSQAGADSALLALRGKEVAVVAGPDGKVVWADTSDRPTYVRFEAEEFKALRANGPDLTMTHNHPDGWTRAPGSARSKGTGPSRDDMMLAVDTNLKTMRVVSPGATYTIERPKGGWPPLARVKRVIAKHDEGTHSIFKAAIPSSTPKAGWPDGFEARLDFANATHWTTVNRLVADELGWAFTETPR